MKFKINLPKLISLNLDNYTIIKDIIKDNRELVSYKLDVISFDNDDKIVKLYLNDKWDNDKQEPKWA